jgi:acid stress chaperone HdeB
MRASIGGLALMVFLWPALFSAPPVKAESLDLDTVSCKTFLEASKEDIFYTLAWLDGYYKGDDDPAVIDFDKLKENAAKLGSYCKEHPDATVATAAEELFGK